MKRFGYFESQKIIIVLSGALPSIVMASMGVAWYLAIIPLVIVFVALKTLPS